MVGTPKHSITYPYPTLAIGSERKWKGSERGWEGARGVRGSEGSKREQAGRDPWPNGAGGHPKTCPHKWWGPQHIPLNNHYALSLLSQLWVRGESWEQGEGLLVQEKWWTPQKLAPQVVGTPKHTPQSPLPLPPSCSPLHPEPPWAPKNFLGPRETLGAFGSLWQPWVFSQTHRPCSPSPPHSLSLPFATPCPLSLPGSLGPSWGLRKP